MRIISKFHDYYDSVGAYDQERSRIYLRNPVQHEISYHQGAEIKRFLDSYRVLDFYDTYDHLEYLTLVGFCGKWYTRYSDVVRFASTASELAAKIQKYLDEDDIGDRDVSGVHKSAINRLLGSGRSMWARRVGEVITPSDEFFIALGAPAISIRKGKRITVDINPRLQDYEFASVLDPYTAYQELDMYMNNQLAQIVDVPAPMTDALKVHSHGYDKWSFRTHAADSAKARRKRK